MFSLIVTVIAIALVAILAVAVIYYGGDSMNKGPAMAAAATLINQSTQVAAAGALSTADGNGWPTGALVFPTTYLKTMPTPPRTAYIPDTQPASSDWEYYLPDGQAHHFVVRDKINKEACMAVNKKMGFNGIPAAWDGVSIIQCFGNGDGGAYTFFYDPPAMKAQNNAALEESLEEGGTSTPGYPRLCADGSTIEFGLCPSANGDYEEEPELPVPPYTNKLFRVSAYPGVFTTKGLTQYGDSGATYCSDDAPAGTFPKRSVLTVGGVSVTISSAWDTCFSVDAGQPALPEGNQPVEVTNPNGTRALGTVRYVETLEDAPILAEINPSSLPYNEYTPVTLEGEGFTPQTVVTNGGEVIPSTYVSSTQIKFNIPPAKFFGYTEDKMYEGNGWMGGGVFVYNPKSAESDSLSPFFYGTDVMPPEEEPTPPTLEECRMNAWLDGCDAYPPPTDEECRENYWWAGCEPNEYPPEPEECEMNPDQANCDASQYPALKIQGFRNGVITFTAVKDCSYRETQGNACLPVFNSKNRVWRWAPPPEGMRETNLDAIDGRMSYSRATEYGITVSDGANTYTLYEKLGYGVNYTYTYIDQFNVRGMSGPGEEAPGYLMRLGVTCAEMKKPIEDAGGFFQPNICDKIITGHGYSWIVIGNYGDRNDSAMLEANPTYHTNYQDWGSFQEGKAYGPDHMTMSASSDINNPENRLVVGVTRHEYEDDVPFAVYSGSQGWPLAPLDTDLTHEAY